MKLFTLIKQSFTTRRPTAVLALFAAPLATAGQAPAQAIAAVDATAGQAVARVSIANLSNQILAPIVVPTHRKGAMPIFTPGDAASSELATLAETGSPVPLETLLRTDPTVLHATHLTGAATVIMPGETVSGDIVFDLHHMSVSIASMLVSTNDAFVGSSGAQIPSVGGFTAYLAHAWDAGSEANTEACSALPGPPARRTAATLGSPMGPRDTYSSTPASEEWPMSRPGTTGVVRSRGSRSPAWDSLAAETSPVCNERFVIMRLRQDSRGSSVVGCARSSAVFWPLERR